MAHGAADTQANHIDGPAAEIDAGVAAVRRARKAYIRARLYMQFAILDCVAIVGGMAAASTFRLDVAFDEDTVHVLAVLLPLFIFCAFSAKSYTYEVLENWRAGVRRTFFALALTSLLVISLGFALKVSSEFSRIAILTGIAISFLLLLLFRAFMRTVVAHELPDGPTDQILLCDHLDLTPIKGSRLVVASDLGLRPTLTDPMMLDRIGKELGGCDRVIVACRPEARLAWTAALKGLGIDVEVMIPEVEPLGVLGTGLYSDMLTAVVARGPLATRDEIIKRAFDVTVITALAPMMLLVLLTVSIAIKLDDRGPIFFRQRRIGHGNRQFDLFKFRSMKVASADATGTVSTRRDDDRITRVGRFLRSTSLDELPQLLNVLKGDMSLVGPRPHALASTAGEGLFWDVDQRYFLRHAAKPGLTGLAQIRGYRGATSTTADLTNRVQADLEYLTDWSLWRDIRILGATIKVVLHPNAF